ncbi:hypothetical protein FQR65_LT06999 [Abscondita terminalis]|nr:hypothetical protein FQR65_LT06999 [Abscondita terminalis]
MTTTYSIVFTVFLQIKICILQGNPGITFPNVVRFPYGGPFMGIFLAIAIPLELPKTNVYLSYNFEANYNLPENQSTYDYPPIVSDRSIGISRKNVYSALEFKLNSHGYSGKDCLLRTICEAAEYDLDGNGVLGDIIHVLLSPSTSVKENLSPDFENAEQQGKDKKECTIYEKVCPVSLLGLISWLENANIFKDTYMNNVGM